MGQKVKVKEKNGEQVSEGRCSHYWIIEIANGPKSSGVCKYCGEQRDFFNSISALNEIKRNDRPFDLPEMPEVELDRDSKS